MLEIVDYRYEWTDAGNSLIICMKNCESGYLFYIHNRLYYDGQAEQILEFWENHCNSFFDIEYEHPN